MDEAGVVTQISFTERAAMRTFCRKLAKVRKVYNSKQSCGNDLSRWRGAETPWLSR
jgi:hypothetical protein